MQRLPIGQRPFMALGYRQRADRVMTAERLDGVGHAGIQAVAIGTEVDLAECRHFRRFQ